MRYRPVSSASAVRAAPVARFLTVTLAPATARPCGSSTWPPRSAVFTCALAVRLNARPRARANRHTQMRARFMAFLPFESSGFVSADTERGEFPPPSRFTPRRDTQGFYSKEQPFSTEFFREAMVRGGPFPCLPRACRGERSEGSDRCCVWAGRFYSGRRRETSRRSRSRSSCFMCTNSTPPPEGVRLRTAAVAEPGAKLHLKGIAHVERTLGFQEGAAQADGADACGGRTCALDPRR